MEQTTNPPERIYRLEMINGEVLYLDRPATLKSDQDDSVEYVRKDIADQELQYAIWHYTGARM